MIFDSRKLKETLFGKNKVDEELELEAECQPNIRSYVLSNSDSAYICSMAAKTCYGKDVDKYYDQNLNHIEKIISYGHDSISAHSNISILITVVSSFNSVYPNIISNLDAMKFFNISLLQQKKNKEKEEMQYTEFENIKKVKYINMNTDKILLSGSVRAYRYYIYKMNFLYDKDFLESNSFYKIIRDTIYSSIPKEFFPDFIKKGILDEEKFVYHPIVVSVENGHTLVEHKPPICGKNVDLWYYDDIESIEEAIKRELGYSEEFVEYTTGKNHIHYFEIPKSVISAILDSTIVTLKLHDYSRAISQQINRHLSGISQESQRYVNYSSAKFIDPTQFTDRYDKDKEYEIEFGIVKFNVTAEKLGKMLVSIYPQLEKQGMINQDARSFLPMNVETKAVHTFTLTNLLHFIKLRYDRAAQPEVQEIASQMIDLVREITKNCSDELKKEVERRMSSYEKDFM